MKLDTLLTASLLMTFLPSTAQPVQDTSVSASPIEPQDEQRMGVRVIARGFDRVFENWYEGEFGHYHGRAVLVTRADEGGSIVVTVQSKTEQATSGVRLTFRLSKSPDGAYQLDTKGHWRMDVGPREGELSDIQGDVYLEGGEQAEGREPTAIRFFLRGKEKEMKDWVVDLAGGIRLKP